MLSTVPLGSSDVPLFEGIWCLIWPLNLHIERVSCRTERQTHGYHALRSNLSSSKSLTSTHNPVCPLSSSHHGSRRLHPNMLIRQPKYHLPIRRRTHVIPRIPRHDARPPFTRQRAHGLDLLGLHLHLALRIPHYRVPVPSTAPDQIPPVGAETHVALPQCPGRSGRRSQVCGRVGALAVCAECAVEGVEEEVSLWVVGSEEERLAVV